MSGHTKRRVGRVLIWKDSFFCSMQLKCCISPERVCTCRLGPLCSIFNPFSLDNQQPIILIIPVYCAMPGKSGLLVLARTQTPQGERDFGASFFTYELCIHSNDFSYYQYVSCGRSIRTLKQQISSTPTNI